MDVPGQHPDPRAVHQCATDEAFDVIARARGFLHDRGWTPPGEQQTKTRTALDYFAKQHRKRPARAPKTKPAAPSKAT